ncbi:dirigent protein 22-like [Lycium barbarum]|uniref:dirigent protein 22-like n=1 Tax=Lycium barbarum TaxID=112863 RepID=UPI00293E83A5|nr:dirigent protein 22-like [Lycium barbarum]
MSKTSFQKLSSTLMILLVFLSHLLTTHGSSKSQLDFPRKLPKKAIRLKRSKTISHLHFYFHDILSGKNPTAVKIVEANMTKNSATKFGSTVMMDDPLTIGPKLSSKLVGRAQGIYAQSSLNDIAYLMVLNFAFVDEGDYNGSTLSILGRNKVLSSVREMPIVGGTGVFRFARGYALAKAHSYDPKTGNAVVEYNVFVLH